MNMHIPAMLAAAFALSLPATTLATADDLMPVPEYHGDVGARAAVSFEELDRNNDGYIHQADIPADHELSTLFSQYDRDGDGRLSRSEFALYARGVRDRDEVPDDEEEEYPPHE